MSEVPLCMLALFLTTICVQLSPCVGQHILLDVQGAVLAARCGVGAGCSAITYQSLQLSDVALQRVPFAATVKTPQQNHLLSLSGPIESLYIKGGFVPPARPSLNPINLPPLL